MVQVVWILIQDKDDAREGCQMKIEDMQTHKKKLNENIRAYQMAGYEVIMHYYNEDCMRWWND